MTPQEQIDYLRRRATIAPLDTAAIVAVCDLAERGLLDDALEAALWRYSHFVAEPGDVELVIPFLRRLLGEAS